MPIFGDRRQYFRHTIASDEIEREQLRLREAHSAARDRIDLIVKNTEALSGSFSIFEVHKAVLEDPSLLKELLEIVSSRRVNAEWAVGIVTGDHIAKYRDSPDEHFRDRAIDIEDVAEHLLTALGGDHQSMELAPGSVLAVRELRPSTLAELSRIPPSAILTENGGWTSHAFILARELEIPAVTGVKGLIRKVQTGDHVSVDAYTGKIVLNPEESSVRRFEATAREIQPDTGPYVTSTAASSPLITLDGREIILRANFDLRGDFAKARSEGVRGIGLFRSEYLIGGGKEFPTEEDQFAVYRRVAKLASEDRARIRTFDISVGQVVEFGQRREQNPALGLRAVRLSLLAEAQCRTQLRALLRAAFGLQIDIILPMVSGLEEVRRVKELLIQESESLIEQGIECGAPRLGVMIEVPAAVLSIEQIVNEVDCILLGTNDLVQYLLAVDRDNESVSGWFRTLHPAVLRALRMVISAADQAAKPLLVCGEMAGSPFYVPLLIGLGARELSMNLNSIPRVRRTVGGIAFEEAKELADSAMQGRTADEVETSVESFIAERWRHLLRPEYVSNRKV